MRKINLEIIVIIMSTPMGFCPHCKQNVLLIREPIDTALAIILFCCTCGLGFFIYLIIYLSKSRDRCIHCNTRITSLSYQPNQTYNQSLPQQQAPVKVLENKSAKFCPFCGSKLDNLAQKYCPSCGTKI